MPKLLNLRINRKERKNRKEKKVNQSL